MSETRPAFVPLATVSDVMTARITVARLESEGIPARVHGEGLGPYRLTVGEFAATQIWVAEDRIDEARQVMMASEIDAIPDPAADETPGTGRLAIAVGAALVLVLLAYRLVTALS